MGQTRRSGKKLYEACKQCEFNTNINIGKCQKGFDIWYKRRSKKNGCNLCSLFKGF